MSEITNIPGEEFYKGVMINKCNNCGAYAEEGTKIKHYDTCRPGEAKYWENFYEEANSE